ncbi:hypothetical protein SAMN05216262_101654 [Colwellia chukchiensis]|uniref:Uncharacterized protein n=1 Tax=Colwellia chukchiensis TaxID=641665 RepID=A0A1H7HZH5_9GAMM|nr:hypothetical protein [Colwellia chukchiensis]SEK55639.1 hypothetical protein SAMN05216262_101654 [Colwellia chukchiensis]
MTQSDQVNVAFLDIDIAKCAIREQNLSNFYANFALIWPRRCRAELDLKADEGDFRREAAAHLCQHKHSVNSLYG